MNEKYILSKDLQSVEVKSPRLYTITKRIIDILGALVGLILLSPIFLLISLIIKIEDPKSRILFVQTRNGINGKIFNMYKFRSMVNNAEDKLEELSEFNEMSGPVFKMKDDPRVTKIGKFIRKTSIDELPQLVNVLKGDMSLVGPRPPIPREVENYNEYQLQRLLVKPGLTCYWQVSGRNDIDFDEWVNLDIKYIKERNLLIDIWLIFKTILVLFGDKHAR